MKSVHLIMTASIACYLVFSSCHKEGRSPGTENPPPDKMVTAGLQGRVLDENGLPVKDATVTSGTAVTTTDVDGVFRFGSIQIAERFGFVKVVKTGYFTGSRTIVSNANAMNFVRIDLIPKVSAGSFSAVSGGNVPLPSGGSVSFATNTIVNATSKAAYTGTVHVYAAYLDPTDENIGKHMPGDLRGIDKSNKETGLQSFGMMAVELEGDGGEKLQIASGIATSGKPTLTMPIPAALQAGAPSSIPLWHFNDSTGKWMEEGTATRSGNNYIGQVGHFSFWNCDAPCAIINFQVHLKDQNGNPVAYGNLEFASETAGTRFGQTDSAGYAQGWIVKGQTIALTVKDDCGNVLYTKSIAPATADIDLGTISVTLSKSLLTLTGTAVDCSRSLVADGFVNALVDGLIYRGSVANGHFTLPVHRCSILDTDIKLAAGDLSSLQLGEERTVSLSSGNQDVGELTACGKSFDQYVRYTINGISHYITSPSDPLAVYQIDGGFQIALDDGNSDPACFIQFNALNAGDFPVASLELGTGNNVFYHSSTTTGGAKSVNGTITRFGETKGYIEGNFSGTVVLVGTLKSYPVSGSFKVIRNF